MGNPPVKETGLLFKGGPKLLEGVSQSSVLPVFLRHALTPECSTDCGSGSAVGHRIIGGYSVPMGRLKDPPENLGPSDQGLAGQHRRNGTGHATGA